MINAARAVILFMISDLIEAAKLYQAPLLETKLANQAIAD